MDKDICKDLRIVSKNVVAVGQKINDTDPDGLMDLSDALKMSSKTLSKYAKIQKDRDKK